MPVCTCEYLWMPEMGLCVSAPVFVCVCKDKWTQLCGSLPACDSTGVNAGVCPCLPFLVCLWICVCDTGGYALLCECTYVFLGLQVPAMCLCVSVRGCVLVSLCVCVSLRGRATRTTSLLNSLGPLSEKGAVAPAARQVHGCFQPGECGGKAAASPGSSSHPRQGRAGPGTHALPSCGGLGLFLSCLAHPGRVFPSNNALFLHPAISAEECAVCVSSRKPKTPIMVSCPAASSSHSFI